MREFWRLISLLVCIVGFLLVGTVMLCRGESLLTAALTAIAAFAVLWIAQGFLRALLDLAAGTEDGDRFGQGSA